MGKEKESKKGGWKTRVENWKTYRAIIVTIQRMCQIIALNPDVAGWNHGVGKGIRWTSLNVVSRESNDSFHDHPFGILRTPSMIIIQFIIFHQVHVSMDRDGSWKVSIEDGYR